MVETGTYARVLDRLASLGLDMNSDRRRERLGIFVRETALWSGRVHLIGKRHIRRTLVQLFADSWAMYLFARDTGVLGRGGGGSGGGARVADLGSGAGFPGLAWKIFDPRLDLILLERREKTARFLERVLSRLALEGIAVFEGNAMEFAGRNYAPFDIVLSKAAGRLSELSAILPRLIRAGGFYITVKGRGWRGELDGVTRKTLRFETSRELPENRGEIVLLSIRDKGL